MAQIGNVPEIIEVKIHLEKMKQNGLIIEWELPYENLLTRRSAAIFFLTPASEEKLTEIWQQLEQYENFRKGINADKKLSELAYYVQFNEDE